MGGRLTREDVEKHLAKAPAPAEAKESASAQAAASGGATGPGCTVAKNACR
ncbi:hypothetical protein MJK70_08080 [Klebsiella pneumoniae]|nr:hypothetical protein MJK70_08080 [Klebsiella pneumoniae]